MCRVTWQVGELFPVAIQLNSAGLLEMEIDRAVEILCSRSQCAADNFLIHTMAEISGSTRTCGDVMRKRNTGKLELR